MWITKLVGRAAGSYGHGLGVEKRPKTTENDRKSMRLRHKHLTEVKILMFFGKIFGAFEKY